MEHVLYSITLLINVIVYSVHHCHMSHVTRKPVFEVCDQIRLKPACSVSTSKVLEILGVETRGFVLSMQRITKALIRLLECAGWPASLLFSYGINRFSHDVAHIKSARQDRTNHCLLPLTNLGIWHFVCLSKTLYSSKKKQLCQHYSSVFSYALYPNDPKFSER